MLNDLQSLAAELGKAPLTAKLTAALAALGRARRPGHRRRRGQPAALRAALHEPGRRRSASPSRRRLAGAQISYRVSQPPGPFVVYVDESTYDEAQIAVALGEGAAPHAAQGISTGEGGASSDLPELRRARAEHAQARVAGDRAPARGSSTSSARRARHDLDARQLAAAQARAAHRLRDPDARRGPRALSEAEANTVAKLVRYRFGVPPENVIISDQSGPDPLRPDPRAGRRPRPAAAARARRGLRPRPRRQGQPGPDQAFGARKALRRR